MTSHPPSSRQVRRNLPSSYFVSCVTISKTFGFSAIIVPPGYDFYRYREIIDGDGGAGLERERRRFG
jgi:hypothetical protein